MTNMNQLKDAASLIKSIIPWVGGIETKEQYNEAIKLMDELTNNPTEENEVLIVLLFPVIERYEENAPELKEFNEALEQLDSGEAILRVLIDQYKLTLSDFKDEIGGKSVVSEILSGKRKLNLRHIKGLSERFNLSPALFF